MFSHFHSDILSGCNIPAVFRLEAFTCWKTKHSSLFMLFHQKCCFKPWYILVPPGCMANGKVWASVSISFLNSSISRTYRHPWYNSSSSENFENPSTGLSSSWPRTFCTLGSSRWEVIILCLRVGCTISLASCAMTPSLATAMLPCSNSICTLNFLVMRADE